MNAFIHLIIAKLVVMVAAFEISRAYITSGAFRARN